jgi:hypothetical protein
MPELPRGGKDLCVERGPHLRMRPGNERSCVEKDGRAARDRPPNLKRGARVGVGPTPGRDAGDDGVRAREEGDVGGVDLGGGVRVLDQVAGRVEWVERCEAVRVAER